MFVGPRRRAREASRLAAGLTCADRRTHAPPRTPDSQTPTSLRTRSVGSEGGSAWTPLVCALRPTSALCAVPLPHLITKPCHCHWPLGHTPPYHTHPMRSHAFSGWQDVHPLVPGRPSPHRRWFQGGTQGVRGEGASRAQAVRGEGVVSASAGREQGAGRASAGREQSVGWTRCCVCVCLCVCVIPRRLTCVPTQAPWPLYCFVVRREPFAVRPAPCVVCPAFAPRGARALRRAAGPLVSSAKPVRPQRPA